MKKQLKTKLKVMGGLIVFAAGHSANAQIEEVIVTAQKKEQNLSDVPISVQAFTADAIKTKRIEDIKDLTVQVPSLGSMQYFRSQTSPAMRGAGSIDDSPGLDQTTAIFLDGIYIGQPGHIGLDMFDIERIEVLRGPQGTLQGRNVTGGAINIITTTPGDESIVKVAVTVGNHGRSDFEALISGPLIDGRLAGQLSLVSRNSDGYISNKITGNDIESDDYQGLRAKLAFTPNEEVSATLSVTSTRDKGKGSEMNLTGNSGVSNDPGFGSSDDLDTDVYLDTDGFIDNEHFNVTAIVDVDTAIGAFTSVTGYYEGDNKAIIDADGTSLAVVGFVGNGQVDKIEQFSQEIRLSGSTEGELEYTTGLYYLNSEHERFEEKGFNIYPGTFLDAIGLGGPSRVIDGTTTDTETVAVFGDLTFPISDRFRTIVGARWTEDTKDYSKFCLEGSGPLADCIGNVIYNAPEKSWDAVSWRIIAQYDINADSMAYANISRGFKSGGLSVPPGVIPAEGNSSLGALDPEYALNYEVGAKLAFADGRVRLNTAAFLTKYTDLQVIEFVSDPAPTTIVTNAEAEVTGVELELAASPVNALDLFFNYTYLDGEYTKYQNSSGLDFSGNDMIFAPESSVSAGFVFASEFDHGGSLEISADILWKDKFYVQADNNEFSQTEYQPLLNANIRYQFPNARWTATLWGQNLTDERFSYGGFDRGILFASFMDVVTGVPFEAAVHRGNPPRSLGITIGFEM